MLLTSVGAAAHRNGGGEAGAAGEEVGDDAWVSEEIAAALRGMLPGIM